jgi:Leucine-rich repeat (LRR) protein
MYAYDNRLTHIEHLEACNRLTHVYLQNNQLTDLSGLGAIKNLAKLYVDNNAIARVEGLEGLLHLQELHISDQRLPEASPLLSSPLPSSAHYITTTCHSSPSLE